VSFQICAKTESAQASGISTAVSLFMFPADMFANVAMVSAVAMRVGLSVLTSVRMCAGRYRRRSCNGVAGI